MPQIIVIKFLFQISPNPSFTYKHKMGRKVIHFLKPKKWIWSESLHNLKKPGTHQFYAKRYRLSDHFELSTTVSTCLYMHIQYVTCMEVEHMCIYLCIYCYSLYYFYVFIYSSGLLVLHSWKVADDLICKTFKELNV